MNGVDQLPALESQCENCEGKGGWLREKDGEWHYCGKCQGAGYVPTAFGEMILSLLRHNLKPIVRQSNP